jgi:hypothetical protein
MNNGGRTLHKPQIDATGPATFDRLSSALEHVTLSVREPAADIKLGTTFYTPVVTLLAAQLKTRRQDIVFCAWPILGCPYHYFEQALPTLYIDDAVQQRRIAFKEMLDTHMLLHDNRPAVLWEVLDLLISTVRWNLRQLIEWTRIVEATVNRDHPGLGLRLQTMADGARQMHDDASSGGGMLTAEIGLTEGVVIPVGMKKPN